MEKSVVSVGFAIASELRQERNDRLDRLARELEDIIDIIVGDLEDCANHPDLGRCYMCAYNGTEACDARTGYCFRYGRLIRTGD